MSELWFGPDGYLDLASLADSDPDSVPPILPDDEVEARHDAIAASSLTTTPWNRLGTGTRWDGRTLGYVPTDPDHGDALAAAMVGADIDLDVDIDLDAGDPAPTTALDDLIDPWLGATGVPALTGSMPFTRHTDRPPR